jgi:hypothetical protein
MQSLIFLDKANTFLGDIFLQCIYLCVHKYIYSSAVRWRTVRSEAELLFFFPSVPWPIPVASRSKAWVCGFESHRGARLSVLCVLSSRGLCDGPIPSQSDYLCVCVCVCRCGVCVCGCVWCVFMCVVCVCVTLFVIKCVSNPLLLQR